MKRKLLLVYVLFAFVLLCTNVYAIVTADLSLVADKTTVKPGENVIVTVELKNLSSAVSSVEGYINIDENVLESISSDMIVVDSNGKIEVQTKGELSNSLSYAFNPSITDADYDVIFNTAKSATNGNDVFFVMDFKNDITDDSEIIKLKYKVKEGIEDADVTNAVKLDCIVAYSADKSDKSDELTANLNIKVTSEVNDNDDANENTIDSNENTAENKVDNNTVDNKVENTNTQNTNTNTNENKNTNTNANENKNTNKANTNVANTNTNKVDNTVSGTTIPAAGLRTVIIPIIVFMILAYVSYTKYIAYKDV